VQADAHDRLTLPVGTPTLDHTEWVKDPDLESSFDPVLDRIQYLAENGLTSLMVLHDFLSRRLTPLQDRPECPIWMYTGVNDIMRLERGPGSSLDEALLAASLNALTVDQFSADLVVPAAVCEPICANQVARTTLLATMPTLDDVDIAPVQRGNQSRGVVILGDGSLVGAAGGHGRCARPGRWSWRHPSKRRPSRRSWWHLSRRPGRWPRWRFWPSSGPRHGQTGACHS
jgi:hypothetical protein